MQVKLPLYVETEGYLPRQRSPSKHTHKQITEVELRECTSAEVTGNLHVEGGKWDLKLDWKAVDGRLYFPLQKSVENEEGHSIYAPLTADDLNQDSPVYVRQFRQITGQRDSNAEFGLNVPGYKTVLVDAAEGLQRTIEIAKADLMIIDGVMHSADLHPAVLMTIEGVKIIADLGTPVSSAEAKDRGPALGLPTIETLLAQGWTLEGMAYEFTGNARDAIAIPEDDVREVFIDRVCVELAHHAKFLAKTSAGATQSAAERIGAPALSIDERISILEEFVALDEHIERKYRGIWSSTLADSIDKLKRQVRERLDLMNHLSATLVTSPAP